MRLFILYLHIFLFHFPSFSSSSSNLLYHPEDSYSLLHFKSSFTIDTENLACPEQPQKTATWKNGTNCCSWHGVTCDTVSGHVIGLNLGCESLQGKIYSNSTLFHLANLQSLNLSSNDFSGTHFHSKFGGFQSLKHLDLSYCNIQGEVPSQISNLSKLISLHLSRNAELSWNETTFKSFMHNATILEELFLEETDMSLINPNLLNLIFNQSSSLISLSLQETGLSGNWRKSILCLPSIQDLDMSKNDNLEGLLPDLSCSTSLRILDLSNCLFKGPILLSFSNLTYLTSLSLKGKFPSLTYLGLSDNKLSGRVPNWLLGIDSLEYLGLSHNMFTSMDQFSGNHWHNLHGLDLSFNLLAGDISLSICNTSSLLLLNLAHNKLTGIIPQCLANLPPLEVLDLQMNKFYGTLPSKFTKHCDLRTLNLNGNLLEGVLPKSLSNCEYLEALNLGGNKLEDRFPYWLQTMQNLEVLVLRGNKLYGPIANIDIKNPFLSLIIFDISNNNFTGPLPKVYIQNFVAMKNVIQVDKDSNSQYLEWKVFGDMTYYDPVTMTVKGNNIVMVKIPIAFANIDLSQNKFDGEIPNFIGELRALKGLNISHNRLTGPIPQSIGNLSNMESLDLSSNVLTGVIPAELTNLNGLEVLNLSHNHLMGEIPQGMQFNTFSNDSYEGNIGLCGFPLSKKCGTEQHSPPSPKFWSEDKFGFGWKPVAIGYGCGTVFGIGLGCCVLLIGKPRWLVMIFGGQPKRRVNRRRTRVRRTNGSTMNHMVQMS
ncbi:hypothetical protein TSUD_256810 [Trifolium subterraneum]|uniref:Leucine-rich repeat-containing N-terminal plant-type domain-containing protein n=1 Tax=Trifolium subterraneum TaxID=3900 RepID=A0A2Z6MEB4_TRISU|nr:hypothetical protein TSUD_256810 [Trifolium subterraneum]